MATRILRSLGALVAGFATVFALSVLTDVLLERLRVFPPQDAGAPLAAWMLALALAYRCAYTVLGGYVAARLAPDEPMRHAVILGIAGTVAALVGVVVGWSLSAHWYPIALAVTALPCTWIGGKLRRTRPAAPPAAPIEILPKI